MAKIFYLLADVDDMAYCRRILTQFNRGGSHRRMARWLFHGQHVEPRRRYSEGQSDQLGALGLVTSVVVLGNTPYLVRITLMSITARRLRQRTRLAALRADPVASAKEAGLHFVTDTCPGIGCQRSGRGFTYRTPHGTPVRDQQELQRMKALGIPPAWTEVWICPVSEGHLQATGRDAKGRKQYRYHPRWRARREQTKYAQMCAFGEVLPVIRRQVEHDLALPSMPRAKVLATVLRLLEITLIRVGNEAYARVNHSFGLTTLRDQHVDITGATLRFQFHGKTGKEHLIEVHDRRLARIVRQCHDLPG